MTEPFDKIAAALSDRYRIERELGSGGMATVYLAEDLKHHRKVAVKVLRPELAAVIGAERFLAEINTTAALQHPHILPLFDSGEAGTFLFYVMPYVEGESLRDRLHREKQLPVSDAIRIATEVSSALDYAHRHGVIHRDIKPENILLHDGQALVADFGIALAVTTAGGHRMTETGLSLGTPQYMSPEQAMGEREITARSDIYALGTVVYEMLIGEPPFTGPTSQAIVAQVITAEPKSLIAQRKAISGAAEDAVLTALQKLPADRFGSAAEFAQALVSDQEVRRPRGRSTGRSAGRRSFSPAILSVAFLAVALVSFFLGGYVLRRPAPPIEFGQSIQVTSEPGLEVQPAISPDGRSVAYAAGTSAETRIYVRQIAGGRATPLTDDSVASQASPYWSPDGTRILYLDRGAAFSAPAAGGSARQELMAGNGSPVSSAAWAKDGQTIAYVVADSLFIRNPAGVTRLLARIFDPALCTWSPSGELIACTSGNGGYLTIGGRFGNLSPSRIVVCRVSDGAIATVTDSTSLNQSPVWSPDGRWLYYVSNRRGRGDIYAARIAGNGHASGDAMRLTTGLNAQSISLSADGSRFAYTVYSAKANVWSLPLPANPPVSTAGATPLTTGSQVIEGVHLSRDAQWLVYDSDLAGNSDIYRLSLTKAGSDPERLTTDPADDFAPDLSPDGREIAFHSWRSGSRDIYVQPLDGRPLQRVTSSPEQELQPRWSPDGSALTYSEGLQSSSIRIVRRGTDGAWQKSVRTLAGFDAAWSPDGRSLAYVTLNGGGSLFVAAADSGAPRIVVDAREPSNPAAESPDWSDDGRTLYFKSHDTKGNASIWSVPAAGGKPKLLIRFDDPTRPSYRSQWAVRRGRAYFTIEDRQGDVWMIDAASH
jgi:eukaryotic-like serine/threonine-protein kinase